MTDPDISKRNKASRRRGAQWQSDLRNGIRDMGFDVERLALTGAEDEGDHVIRFEGGHFLIIEAKTGPLANMSQYVREAQAERLNFAKHRDLDVAKVDYLVALKRPRSNWLDAYAVTTLRDFFTAPAKGATT